MKTWMKTHRSIMIFIMSALFAVVIVCFCLFGRGTRVETTTVTKGPIEDWYTESGTISSGTSVNILSKVSGDIQEIRVEENQHVQKGDVLICIDPTEYEYSKAQTEKSIEMLQAELSQSDISHMMTTTPQEYLEGIATDTEAAEAALQKASTDFNATQTLFETGDVSKAEYDAAKAAYDAAKSKAEQCRSRLRESRSYLAELKKQGMDEKSINQQFYKSEEDRIKAQVASAEIDLHRLEDRISDCTIRADRDGIVTSVSAKEASGITEGQVVATLSGSDTRKVEADVLTDVAPYIHVGTKVRTVLKLRGQDEIEEGSVDQVNDFATEGSSALGLTEYRVHVRAALADSAENEEGSLAAREGYGVDVQFLLYENAQALSVPAGAVFENDGHHYVYRIEGRHAVKTEVELDYTSGTRSILSSGVSEGDRLLAQAESDDVFDGMKVRV